MSGLTLSRPPARISNQLVTGRGPHEAGYDPTSCAEPFFRAVIGLAITIILDALAAGSTNEELLDSYPWLALDDLRAAIAYGTEASRGHFIRVPTERSA